MLRSLGIFALVSGRRSSTPLLRCKSIYVLKWERVERGRDVSPAFKKKKKKTSQTVPNRVVRSRSPLLRLCLIFHRSTDLLCDQQYQQAAESAIGGNMKDSVIQHAVLIGKGVPRNEHSVLDR